MSTGRPKALLRSTCSRKQTKDVLVAGPMAFFGIKVQTGTQAQVKRLNPTCTVAEALEAINLSGGLQDAQGITLRATETLSAGVYTLHTQLPLGGSSQPLLCTHFFSCRSRELHHYA